MNRLVTSPKCVQLSLVNAFYEGLCACASLHPDVNTAEEEMSEDTWFHAEEAFEDAEEDAGEDANVAKWRRTE